MAKLGIYYGLCPLIDQKSLLGVSEDKQNGCVIVTLGKNMAIKYKLSDQKQLNSWSTKEKLTSPVLYDRKSDKYVAVFNQNYLKIWGVDDETDLDKIKKYKFSTQLHTILSGKDEPILVFKNGFAQTLSNALQNRKEIPNKDLLKIISSTNFYYDNKEYVGSMVQIKNVHKFICTAVNEHSDDSVLNVEIFRQKFKLLGHVIMDSDNGPLLYTLWSDGRLFSYPLFGTATGAPGNFYSVIETLSRQNEICMVPLNKNYFAMFGADVSQEGASLQLYNTQFKITQSRLQFKFFSEGSKLWTVQGNTLLLTVGQNLAVIPYSLATEQLAALVGSHKLATNDDDDLAIVTEVLVENWGQDLQIESRDFQLSPKLKTEITSLTNEGWSEFAICETIFPKLIEKNNKKSILELLDHFLDIPDLILVKLLSYCIRNQKVNVQNPPDDFSTFLNKLLATSYNDSIIMPHLRLLLTFDDVLILLQYLSHFLSSQSSPLPTLSIVESESKVIDWACLLIDSHYQQFLLLKDEKIIDVVNNLKGLIDNYYSCLEEFKMAEPVISRLKRGKNDVRINQNEHYSIEKIKLY